MASPVHVSKGSYKPPMALDLCLSPKQIPQKHPTTPNQKSHACLHLHQPTQSLTAGCIQPNHQKSVANRWVFLDVRRRPALQTQDLPSSFAMRRLRVAAGKPPARRAIRPELVVLGRAPARPLRWCQGEKGRSRLPWGEDQNGLGGETPLEDTPTSEW